MQLPPSEPAAKCVRHPGELWYIGRVRRSNEKMGQGIGFGVLPAPGTLRASLKREGPA
jgi:hypothetical protein